jgi:Na+/proline symporter
MLLGKVVLGISSFNFIIYGLASLASPTLPAGLAGLGIMNADGFAEIGGMYGGLQTGIGLFCLLALIKPAYYRTGLSLLAICIGTLAVARLVSLLRTADTATIYTHGALLYEFATTLLAGIALRDKKT